MSRSDPADAPLTLTVTRDALLSHPPPSLAAAIKKELTIENPRYREAKKFGRWIGKGLRPYLEYFQEEADGLRFPRGFANQTVRLCRAIAGRDPAIIDQRRTLPQTPLTFTGQLRPYQQRALAAILRHDFGVLEAGTGSGKTVIALAAMASRTQPTLVLVHTKELLYQWQARVQEFLGVEAGLLGDGHHQLAPITIAIVNSARRHLAELAPRFGQLCVDECHRVPASLFTEVVTAFDCRYLLGLSATAFRRDGLTKLIYIYLGEPVHRLAARELEQAGAILRPEFHQHPTRFRYVYRGNYQALLKALTSDRERNLQIVADIVAEAERSTGAILVVSDRIKHCEELARLLAERGFEAAVLTGRLNATERSRLVARLRDGAIKILISTLQLIGEGFDCPGLQTLFLTTPIKFSGRLLQVVGRVLRPAEGKQARVHDYFDPVAVLQASAQARRRLFAAPEEELPPGGSSQTAAPA